MIKIGLHGDAGFPKKVVTRMTPFFWWAGTLWIPKKKFLTVPVFTHLKAWKTINSKDFTWIEGKRKRSGQAKWIGF
jgi:hypothetical protein